MADWSEIRRSIKSYVAMVFIEETLAILDNEIDEAITIFIRVATTNTGYKLWDGLGNIMQTRLQEACVDKVGSGSPIKDLLTSIDPYMKRLLLLSGEKTYPEFNRDNGTAGILLQECANACGITMPPKIGDQRNTTFKNRDGLHLFAEVKYARDTQTHNAENMNPFEVAYILKFLFAFYVWWAHLFKAKILHHHRDFADPLDAPFANNNEDLAFYDCLRYSNSINEVKEHLIRALISSELLKKDSMSVEELRQMTAKKLSSDYTLGEFENIVNSLCAKKKLEYEGPKRDTVRLPENERNRLLDLKSDYILSEGVLTNEIRKLLPDFLPDDHATIVLQLLRALFEEHCCNSLIDNIDIVADGPVKKFRDSLLEIGVPEESVTDLTEKLVKLGGEHTISKLAACKVISKLSNSDIQEIRAEREVYLDTQVVLYLLCLHPDMTDVDSPRYHSAKALSDIMVAKNKYTFKFSNHYYGEIIHHIEEAVGLIPIVDNDLAPATCLSSNVFYVHFFILKQEGHLPEGVENFGQYMWCQFKLEYEDFISNQIREVAFSAITQKFFDINLSIDEDYDLHGFSNHESTYKDVLVRLGKGDKKTPLLTNDAKMGCILFNKCAPGKICPFFITHDRTFQPFRDDYLRRYARSAQNSWRVFSPATFLSYRDINKLKIKDISLTQEILLMVKDEVNENRNFFDSLQQLTSNKALSVERRKSLQHDLLQNDRQIGEDEKRRSALVEAMNAVIEHYNKNEWKVLCSFINEDDTYIQFLTAITKVTDANEEQIKALLAETDSILKKTTK